MRLINAEVSGYRRFAAKSEMDLDGELICIVGPNGAGKSSFLDALVHLSDEKDFEQPERTRAEGGVLAPSLRAEYALDADDRTALAGIPEAADASEFVATKTDADGLRFRVQPYPGRNMDLRERSKKLLAEFLGSRWLEAAAPLEEQQDPPTDPATTALAQDALEVASSDGQVLSDEQTASFGAVRDRITSIVDGDHLAEAGDLAEKYARLPEALDKLIEHEQARHPHIRAIDELRQLQPRFVKFDRDNRELDPEYSLADNPDQPVDNLLALAGSSWAEVVGEIGANDTGRKISLLDRLNKRLSEEFTKAWDQTDLTVRLDVDNNVLKIVMSMHADDYIPIDQHSDGLRQFVALRAFVALHGGEHRPVVLIDEAETHLHYDAQADLVEVFEEQDEAAAILYTTHSAGCLPRDLGLGLRGIVPIYKETDESSEMTDHSRIMNEFWYGEKGFAPLLIAMGASAFAFSSAQKALVSEGFTDSLLLPTLLRQACEVSRLEYQVVPDFARAKPDEILDFDLLAARVAYLADGDQGGKDHVENKLKPNGVVDEQVLFLGGDGSGTTLEDLVDQKVFLEVINVHLDEKGAGVQLAAQDLPKTGRMNAVETWCGAQSVPGAPIEPPTKPELARALLARRKDVLITEAQRKILVKLDEDIRAILGTATNRLAELKRAGRV
jgi:ABC-type transport system involved in cytochrome c biogenesis ATPase subunit